jgi:hypothetical protein
VLANLLLGLDELSALLVACIEDADWLDAYLVAAGINQVAEDYLAGADTLALRAADHLGSDGIGREVARGAQMLQPRRGSPSWRRLVNWQHEVAAICLELGAAVLLATPARAVRWHRRAMALQARLGQLPVNARRDRTRLPACFYRFDTRPEDSLSLAARVADWLPRDRRVLVLGVRTSGGYLAPLQVAALGALGYRDVRMATLRPGQRIGANLRRELCRLDALAGEVLIVDDPPSSGRALRRIVEELRRAGVSPRRMTLVVPLFDDTIPGALANARSVTLPWFDWSIHRRLLPAHVAADVEALLGPGARVISARPLAFDDQPTEQRGHVSAAYAFELEGPHDRRWHEFVAVEGAGVGYFGTQALAVSRALGPSVARVLGVRDGVIYREWLDPAGRLAGLPAAGQRELSPALVAHVADRARKLALATDPGDRQRAQGAPWQVASLILSRGFGAGAIAARLVASDRAIRRLLRLEHPALIDGSTEFDRWFTTATGGVVKVGRSSGYASKLPSFDPVFDLAGIAAGTPDALLADMLRAGFAEQKRERVDAERWLLYQLVHLWDRGRRRLLSEADVADRSGLAVRRYLAEVLFAGATCPAAGPSRAVHFDLSAKRSRLGWLTPTPASVLAIRALMVHGYRPTTVSGCSLVDLALVPHRPDGTPGGGAELVLDPLAPIQTGLGWADSAALSAAVADIVGHRPGGCSLCAAPPLGRGSRVVLALLSAGDGPRRRRFVRTAELTVLAWAPDLGQAKNVLKGLTSWARA